MSADVIVDNQSTNHLNHGPSNPNQPQHVAGNPNSRSSIIHRDESELWEHDSDFSDGSHTTTSSENYDYSLEDIISYIKLGRYQWFVMLLAGVVWFSAAIQLMCTSILLLNLKDLDAASTISNEEEAVLAATPFAGEIVGSITMSIFSDKYGRKKAILIAALCLSFFGTLSAISYDFYMLVICRFMSGFAVGTSLNCLSLVTEFIPQKHRGEMSYVEVSFWSLGAIYAIAIGWLIFYAGLDWRWYLASISAPSWLCVVLIFFIPESPRWLLNNGDFEALHRQIEVMAYWNNADLSILRGNLIQPQAVEEAKKGSVAELFRPQHIRTSIQVLIASFFATLSYFGVALFQVEYFTEKDASFDDIFWELLVCTSSEIPGTILGIIIFDHVGRIPFLSSTFFISMLCFVGLVFSPTYVGVALIFLARMSVSVAYNILIVYILEYFPTTIRATALGFCITTARFAGISTSFVVQEMSTSKSSVVFAAACAVCTIMVVLLPEETLGRELMDDSDDMLDEMVENVLTEYDQSTLPLMQHQPARQIREQMEEAMRLRKSTGGGVGGEDTDDVRLALAATRDRAGGASKSAFF